MQILLIGAAPPEEELTKALKAQGYVIKHIDNRDAAIHILEADKPDIVVLDIDFPEDAGFGILESLRQKNRFIPILLLTSGTSLEHRVACLDLGADEYLLKPFAMPEFLARLRVFERRLTNIRSSAIRIGRVFLDAVHQRVTLDGKEVPLPRKEYMLLKRLMENAGQVQTRGQLENHLYNWEEEVASNAVEVHIHYLRKKLGKDFIKTVRGVGYKVVSKPGAVR